MACEKSIKMRHPVSLANVTVPPQMGRGEEFCIQLQLDNLSGFNFLTLVQDKDGGLGTCEVELRVRLDRRFLPLPLPGFDFSETDYLIKFHPALKDSVYIGVKALQGRASLLIKFPIMLEGKAELFDQAIFQAELFLYGKLVEYFSATIRVAPYFVSRDPPGDALFVTGRGTTRANFLQWQCLLETMKLDVDFWDTERYEGLSFFRDTGLRHEVTWVDRYADKLIIIPDYRPDILSGKDVAQHFALSKFRDSAMLIMPAKDWEQKTLLACLIGSIANEKIENITSYGENHCLHPLTCLSSDEEDKIRSRRIRKLLKKLNNPWRTLNSAVIYRREDIEFTCRRCCQWSFGNIEFRRLQVPRTERLCFLEVSSGDVMECSPDPVSIPLASPWAQLLLVILSVLPARIRRDLFDSKVLADGESSDVLFTFPWGENVDLPQLAAMSVQAYLSDEISKTMRNFHKLKNLCTDIQENTLSYTHNASVFSRVIFYMKDYCKQAKEVAPKPLQLAIRRAVSQSLLQMKKELGSKEYSRRKKRAFCQLRKETAIHFTQVLDASGILRPCNVKPDDDLVHLNSLLSEENRFQLELLNQQADQPF